jgi:uncharacterized membrane protein YhaH (DUF805 family)
METLLKQFDSFLKRSMLPSSVLISILMLFSYRESENFNSFIESYQSKIDIIQGEYLLVFLLFILLIAISFVMKILTQILFDNMLKQNFKSHLLYFHENHMLLVLRLRSIEKLKQENHEFDEIEMTDFFLYQVIGRKLQFLEHPTNTKRYIDDTKSAGSIFIAFLITIFIIAIKLLIQNEILYSLITILFMLFTWVIAIEYIKSKYRSRAIRIYTNYLIGNNETGNR